jgi:glycosyl transferase, family 25
VQTYFINLDGSEARRAAAEDTLTKAGLSWERVPAVDGRGKPASSFAEYDSEQARAYMGRDLLGGEVACYLSHVRCVERFLQTAEPDALVVEDDMSLVPDAAAHLASVLTWLAAHPQIEWDVINVGCLALKVATPLTKSGPHILSRAHYFPMSTIGLLWSRRGAERFLATRGRIRAPIDAHLRYWQTRAGRGLATFPALVQHHEDGTSEIDGPGTLGRTKSGGARGLGYFLRKQRRTLVGNAIAWRHYLSAQLGRR